MIELTNGNAEYIMNTVNEKLIGLTAYNEIDKEFLKPKILILNYQRHCIKLYTSSKQ